MSKLKIRVGTRGLTQSAIFAAILCLLSPIAIPVGPVPVTLGVFAVLLSGIILDCRRAFAAVLVYLLMGCLGLPVFSGGNGGFGVLTGPTGGYLWAYLPMTILVSRSSRVGGRMKCLFACLAAMILCYVLGTLQFTAVADMGWDRAMALCVWPFVPFDLLKVVGAVWMGLRIRTRLKNMGLA